MAWIDQYELKRPKRTRGGKLTDTALMVRWYAPDGKLKTKRGFLLKTEAEDFAHEIETDKTRGQYVDPTAGKTSVATVASRFMGSAARKAKTQADYQSILETHILPAFGGRSVASLNRSEIMSWSTGLQDSGLSAARTGKALWLLRAILDLAEYDQLIARNPAKGIKRPKVVPREIEPLTATQVEAIAQAIREPYGVFIRVLAYCGLRFGEAVALRRKNFDEMHLRLRVAASIGEISGRLSESTTKTHEARDANLPPTVAKELTEYMAEHTAQDPEAWIFEAPRGGPIRYQNFRSRYWQPALADAGLPVTGLHILRHTCASLLAHEGVNIDQVGAQLGHRSPQTTAKYRHFYPEAGQRRGEALDAARTRALAQLERDALRAGTREIRADSSNQKLRPAP